MIAGAREMMKAVEYMWGWEATTLTGNDSDWDKIYETLVLDSQNVGVDEFLKENAYQYQSITARMIETIRKESRMLRMRCCRTWSKSMLNLWPKMV